MATNPTLITTPFAQSGDKTTPPNTNTPSDGRFSQTLGFPPVTAIPLGSGGKAPKREDFNGAFNMLSNLMFYAQKGWTFQYDASQDYYAGCIVIDPYDGLRYVCVSDMSAGTKAPHSDSSNTYWQLFKSGIDSDQIPAFNKRDVVTTSGTYTAPVTGWYKITVKGGGGGGAGGDGGDSNGRWSGGGGGEGGITIAYERITAGNTATVVIGGGGAGGSSKTDGSDGGNSSVSVNSHTYTGNGGKGGSRYNPGGQGGTGTINGAAGGSGSRMPTSSTGGGGNGGGNGGGKGGDAYNTTGTNGTQGGGAGGGASANGVGGIGGNGFVWFEYFDSSLNP